MLHIKAQTIAEAWEKSFLEIVSKGKTSDDPELQKEEVLVLEIENPQDEDRFHPLFPMEKSLMEEYNAYILGGGELGGVAKEHALYHKRLFSFPPTSNNQVQAIINKLKEKPHTKRAQASLWFPPHDQKANKTPCLQIFWCKICEGKLEMHTHMRANDAYKKLLMNLNIFFAVGKYIADSLGVSVGKYVHFVDSFHTYKKDAGKIRELITILKRRGEEHAKTKE